MKNKSQLLPKVVRKKICLVVCPATINLGCDHGYYILGGDIDDNLDNVLGLAVAEMEVSFTIPLLRRDIHKLKVEDIQRQIKKEKLDAYQRMLCLDQQLQDLLALPSEVSHEK